METNQTEETIHKEWVLNYAKNIAIEEYGNIIEKELPLNAKLVGDTVWVIEGSLRKNADGGVVYIEIRKKDNKLLKITHYK